VNNAVKLARKASVSWSKTDLSERVEILRKLIDVVKSRKKDLATLITREVGKPITESMGEVDVTAGEIAWFLSEGKSFLEDERMSLGGKEAKVSFEPLGVVGAISPWNFPFDNPFIR